jgi:hypothetical protein
MYLDGVSKSFQIAHEGFVTFQESLGSILVLAEVDVASQQLFLLQPRLGLVGIGEVLMGL